MTNVEIFRYGAALPDIELPAELGDVVCVENGEIALDSRKMGVLAAFLQAQEERQVNDIIQATQGPWELLAVEGEKQLPVAEGSLYTYSLLEGGSTGIYLRRRVRDKENMDELAAFVDMPLSLDGKIAAIKDMNDEGAPTLFLAVRRSQ